MTGGNAGVGIAGDGVAGKRAGGEAEGRGGEQEGRWQATAVAVCMAITFTALSADACRAGPGAVCSGRPGIPALAMTVPRHTIIAMIRCSLALLLLVSLPALRAQTAPAPAAPASPPAAAPAENPALTALRSQVEIRQHRVTALVNQIMELDAAIEAAVTKVQGMLTGITDSKASDTKVARIKRDVMLRLKKAIDYYIQKRTALTADVRATTNKFERTDLFKDRSAFDDRINRRIDGIIQLAVSMDSHEEYEKFLYSGSSDGWNIPHIRRNPDYDHNLKTARQKDAAVTEIEKALSDSLARLDTEERSLKQRIETAKPEQKAALEQELQRLRTIKMQRYDQEEDLRSHPEKKVQAVDMKAAQQIEDVIEEIAADARRDFASLLARYNELKAERTALARLQLRLEAAETAAAAEKK